MTNKKVLKRRLQIFLQNLKNGNSANLDSRNQNFENFDPENDPAGRVFFFADAARDVDGRRKECVDCWDDDEDSSFGGNRLKRSVDAGLPDFKSDEFYQKMLALLSRGRCYKTFYRRNLRVFMISYDVCPRQAFPT